MVPRQRKDASSPGRWLRRSRAFGCTADHTANSASHTLGSRSQRVLSWSESAEPPAKTPQTTVFPAETTGPEELTGKPELDNQNHTESQQLNPRSPPLSCRAANNSG